MLLLTPSPSLQAPGAGGVGAEEQEAAGEAAPVSVPGPDVLGEPGGAAGHRQADRRDRAEGQRAADLRQRSRDQSRRHECVTRDNADFTERPFIRGTGAFIHLHFLSGSGLKHQLHMM